MSDLAAKVRTVFTLFREQTNRPSTRLHVVDIQTGMRRLWPSEREPSKAELVETLQAIAQKAAGNRWGCDTGIEERYPSNKDAPPFVEGPPWHASELEAIVNLYPQVSNAIHENNPDIQGLARKLGRRVRPVEAQLIMCRSMERGEYAWSHVSQDLKDVWDSSQDEENHEVVKLPPATCYPNRFSGWAADREGSVKRPFIDSSGRPVGELIKTTLTDHTSSLAQEIATGKKCMPCVVLLAGGAGNGKSEALELFLTEIANESSDPDHSLKELKKSFDTHQRRVEIDCKSTFKNQHLSSNIRVVQDASESDATGQRSGKLLADDLNNALQGTTFLICCANRGILESARASANEHKYKEVIDALSKIILALDRSAVSTNCWPLDGLDEVYVWPMDLEYLTQGQTPKSPCDQLIQRACQREAWSTEVLSRPNCPIALNRERLADESKRLSLETLIHHFQFAVGSSWTFRNLISLFGHLLSGGNLLEDRESPEELSQRLSVDPQTLGVEQQTELYLDRLRGTYQQQLFPIWPDGKWLKEACSQGNLLDGAPYLHALGSYLVKVENLTPNYSIERTLVGPFLEWLDPARIDDPKIEVAFNESVHQGINANKTKLSNIEIDGLLCLKNCEEELLDGMHGGRFTRSDKFDAAHRAIWFLRKLGSTLTKRALLVLERRGLYLEGIQDYLKRLQNEDLLESECRLIKKIFASSDNAHDYVVSGDHVVGQPANAENVRLSTELPGIKASPLPSGIKRPAALYREFHVYKPADDGDNSEAIAKIPYDFAIYQRLRAREDGVLDGCLEPALRSAFDRVRLSLDGLAARGWESEMVTTQIQAGQLGSTESLTIRMINSSRPPQVIPGSREVP